MAALRPLALILALPLVSACNADSSDNGDVASTQVFVSDFADACLASLNWNRAGCECAGRLAADEFSGDARAFVLAMIRGDDATTERLRGVLSFEELTAAGLFMVHAGTECGTAS
ncbi:MAG: hypothetical protein HKN04_09875 [Rhodothermaceae bacterium]|nr:hypothetical protein [Rhodothermaceae bacterium]